MKENIGTDFKSYLRIIESDFKLTIHNAIRIGNIVLCTIITPGAVQISNYNQSIIEVIDYTVSMAIGVLISTNQSVLNLCSKTDSKNFIIINSKSNPVNDASWIGNLIIYLK